MKKLIFIILLLVGCGEQDYTNNDTRCQKIDKDEQIKCLIIALLKMLQQHCTDGKDDYDNSIYRK